MLPADDAVKYLDPGEEFQSLYLGDTVTLLEDYELGGVAIQDPTQGLEEKVWRCYVVQGRYIIIEDTQGSYSATWYESPLNAISEVSFTFDQNMRPVIAFVDNLESKLLYYDTLTEEVIVENFGSGISSPKVALDEKRQFYGQISDVIFSYIKNGSLYIRLQRDRYGVEYELISGLPANFRLLKTGRTRGYRFQWQFYKPWTTEEKLTYTVDRAPDPYTEIDPPYQVSGTTATSLTADDKSIWGVNPTYIVYALQDPNSGEYWVDSEGNLLIHAVRIEWDD